MALSDFDYQADINLGEWERSPGYFEGAPVNIPQQRKGDNFSYCGIVDCRSNKNEMCNVKCCRYVRRKTTPVA